MDLLSEVQQKLLSYLNRKSYSQLELVQRLSSSFSQEEVQAACDWAARLGLLEKPQEMAERYAAELSRKGKGSEFIAAALLKKGLPALSSEPENDLKNARQVLEKKFRVKGALPSNLGQRAFLFLSQRGFPPDIIRQAVGSIDEQSNDTTTSS